MPDLHPPLTCLGAWIEEPPEDLKLVTTDPVGHHALRRSCEDLTMRTLLWIWALLSAPKATDYRRQLTLNGTP